MTLADFIVADMRSHLDAKGEPPCKLTYESLSRHYQVSLTPVRAAIERLVDEKYLALLDNGRLEVAPRGKRRMTRKTIVAPTPVDHESNLRDFLVEKSLVGDQSYLREEQLAATFGIGRTVLRPILSRLVGSGVLEHVPRCGWRPRPYDARDLQQYLEVRELLEPHALDQAYPLLDREVLEELLAQNQSGVLGKTGDLDNNLHGYWVRLADNRFTAELLMQQAAYHTRLLDYAAPAADVVSQMAAQHCDILTELLAGRRVSARRALVDHIRAQKPIVETLIEKLRSSRAKRTG
ncbi:GntR family transcriptional regulator [Aeoliella sp. SH292]|uniref:GntR family transcriptional regulator n=1 Tax=Aeoliella sp. SH292 TaxID=3454464 RepID=UPI003F9944C5